MKRVLTLTLLSISLSVAVTLLATRISLMVRSARHTHVEPELAMLAG